MAGLYACRRRPGRPHLDGDWRLLCAQPPSLAGPDADSPCGPEVHPGRRLLYALEVRRARLHDLVCISIVTSDDHLRVVSVALALSWASFRIEPVLCA